VTQRVLITGAASGLGWEMTQLYFRDGWYVILVDRDQNRLAECNSRLQANHSGQFKCSCVNLTDDTRLAAALEPALRNDAGLDLLINNAGVTHRSQASVTDLEVFDRVMSVNWRAPIHLTRLCLASLHRCHGAVICVSSMAAWMPVPGRAAYGASKAALKLHFEAWRPELLQRGISLFMVYPSFVATSIEQNAPGK
jgi:dehydrogenase/reductase SDR family member 7B